MLLLVAGAELDLIGARNRQGDLQRIDRIEAKPIAEQRCFRIDGVRRDLKMQSGYDQGC